jgi:protein disulfide-isomerase
MIAVALTAGLVGYAAQRPFPSTNSDAATRKTIDDALATAKSSGRVVLLNFGADWCPECRVLDKVFADPAVAQFLNSNFIVVKIDVGSMVGLNYTEKNIDLTMKYGALATTDSVAIPFVVVLDATGKVVDRTNKGEWKHAPAITPENVLAVLKSWAPKR